MGVIFKDRMGNVESLQYYAGESLYSVLVRNHVPVTSVISTCKETPVNENIIIKDDEDYHVKLIEGYDIRSIIHSVFDADKCGGNYLKNRVTFNLDGSLYAEHVEMDSGDIVKLVEENIRFTSNKYKLINKNEKVLVGLSGGVDSSSLLIALNKLSKEFNFTVIAATFEDFDSNSSPAFKNAKSLADSLNIEHKLIEAKSVEEVFNLNKAVKEILPELVETECNHYTMYADHHLTRRALEIYAKKIGASKIILGLHTTDLVAGLLNSFTTGYYIADIFKRQIGDMVYIYPLMHVHKKELHLYYYAHIGKYADHSFPNDWEINPKDRNYYYYLADQLIMNFPGIENYLFEAHKWRMKRQPPLVFTQCVNCGSHVLQQELASVNEEKCDICSIFEKLGYINSD